MTELRKLVMGLKKINEEKQVKYHPEVNVFNHTVQCTFVALKETHDFDCIRAIILHDVGKNVASIDHEKLGAMFIEPYVSEKTLWLVKNHLRIYYYTSGKMRSGKAKMLYGSKWFPELVRLSRWDSAGRKPDFNLSKGVLDKFDRILDDYKV